MTRPRRNTREYTAWQVGRTINLLAWFRNHPGGSLTAAAEQFGVSVPQLRHELVRATECGLPGHLGGGLVDVALDANHADVVDSQGLDAPFSLTDAEAGVLLFCLERLSSVLPADQRGDVASAAGKIRTLLRESRDRREGWDSPAGGDGDGDDDPATGGDATAASTMALLNRAVGDRRQVAFDYLSASSDTRRRRTLVPDHVGVVGGEGYLWGRETTGTGADAVTSDQRCFAVSRITGAEVLDLPAPPVRRPRITADDPFGMKRAAERGAEITLTPDAAWMLEYLQIWPTQDSTPEVPTALIPDTGAWLERFLIAYSPGITGVAPGEVRDRVARRTSRALAAYRDLA
jgi:proteasome accessory factor C